MSDTSARASRFAFAFGSLARNGLMGGRAGVALAAPVAAAGGAAGGGGGGGGCTATDSDGVAGLGWGGWGAWGA